MPHLIRYRIYLLLVAVSCNDTQETNLDFRQSELTSIENTFEVSTPVVLIKGGNYKPLYGKDTINVTVGDFEMDVYPATKREFQAFVKSNKTWQKSNIKKLFADEAYLNDWESDTTLGENLDPESPITLVSWYAAQAYCQCQGKRLPTVDEWEYVAMANQSIPDARIEKDYNESILHWYETPKTSNNKIGSTEVNYWGVYDMHGLVWEWAFDFNSVLLTGESRNDSETDKNLFCGSGSINATDLMNYAAFMRYAFRGSIKADYSIKNLGFRCVKDLKSNNHEDTI